MAKNLSLNFFYFFTRNEVGIWSDSYHSARIRLECVGEGKVLIVIDQLLVFQMDRKSINSGALSMHRKFKYIPTAFSRSNIACIQILLNLITVLVISKTNGSAIMAFEDIFGNVFA